MQAPEQPYFMAQIMIYKMSKLPNYIAVDKPVPGKCSGEEGIRLQKPNAKSNCRNGNKPTGKTVKNINKKHHFIIGYFESFIKSRSYNFNN